MTRRFGRRLGRAFFRGDTTDVARRLLGTVLVHDDGRHLTAGRIVETEAYLAEGDPASHSAAGRTARNASMFLGPGRGYVYRIYGVHLCFNVVTAERGMGEAVLVRALEPLEGLECMAARRGRSRPLELCRGPGRLAQALGIDMTHDGVDLTRGPLGIHAGNPASFATVRGRRVGITRAADRLLRYTIQGARWVSRPACEGGPEP